MSKKREKIDPKMPRYNDLLQKVFDAIKELGGSANNNEIVNQVIKDLHLSDELADLMHKNSNETEIEYQIAWAKTYLKKSGILENSTRGVWSISKDFSEIKEIDEKSILRNMNNNYKTTEKCLLPEDDDISNNDLDFPDEIKPWKDKLLDVLQNMNPYGFERLAQRLLRECGFSNVQVTKKSGDGGIDGIGKLKINGIFSFNIAFQCKRYKSQVTASEIRDFRGSLTTDIEKGVFITTSSFTKQAKEEASNPGKQQIDLIDGDEFIDKIAEYQIGVKPITIYEIDKSFFEKIWKNMINIFHNKDLK